ncbi:hypothetical protein F4778DRAFT_724645 [Xylariomycetidae sp. FL2044]|nr:hypothetical protein F4778DRAFT_724645 [Xylariomycetidae sp. FL2044]
MHVLSLPTELLCLLPNHLRNIEDFNNAAASCRTLYDAFQKARPETILRLAAASAPAFFSPHPHFLVMATARQVAEWAIGDETRTAELCRAFQGGIDGLYDLCLSKAGLTLQDIRRLHAARFDIINPLSDDIDKMAGAQWYETESFWNGGVSEPATLETEPVRATFQMVIYGELFASTMESWLDPSRGLPRFDLEVRLEYIKYCIPDRMCSFGYEDMRVLASGPYQPDAPGPLGADQVALEYILNCGRWNRMWERVTREVGPDLEPEWKQKLWRDSLQTLGLEGMALVTIAKKRGLSDSWKRRLRGMRSKIEALDAVGSRPGTYVVPIRARIEISQAPDPGVEVHACMARYWPGTQHVSP